MKILSQKLLAWTYYQLCLEYVIISHFSRSFLLTLAPKIMTLLVSTNGDSIPTWLKFRYPTDCRCGSRSGIRVSTILMWSHFPIFSTLPHVIASFLLKYESCQAMCSYVHLVMYHTIMWQQIILEFSVLHKDMQPIITTSPY